MAHIDKSQLIRAMASTLADNNVDPANDIIEALTVLIRAGFRARDVTECCTAARTMAMARHINDQRKGKLLKEALEKVDRMTPEEFEAMRKAQAESWARAEASWPRPKFRMIKGTKVYDSYEDYLNG